MLAFFPALYWPSENRCFLHRWHRINTQSYHCCLLAVCRKFKYRLPLRREGWVDWSLCIQHCSHEFESQWQWVRSAILSDTVFCRSLSCCFLGGTVSSTNKKLQRLNSKLVASYGGWLSAHLLSLHKRTGVTDSLSAVTSCKLKSKCASKYSAFIYLFISQKWVYVLCILKLYHSHKIAVECVYFSYIKIVLLPLIMKQLMYLLLSICYLNSYTSFTSLLSINNGIKNSNLCI